MHEGREPRLAPFVVFARGVARGGYFFLEP
jgi:hypothetical protein